MARYRKLPVEIEAVRVVDFREGRETPQWLIAAIASRDVVVTPSTLVIGTLEGDMRAQRDDYIIRGTKGEIYPCKPDIFEMTYEPVRDGITYERGFGPGDGDSRIIEPAN